MIHQKRISMAPSCPISLQRVDSNFVRLISVQIASVSLLLLLTHNYLLVFLLFMDFSLRLLRVRAISPFAIVALFFVKKLQLTPRPSDEAPKRFALYLGWSMSLLMVLFVLFGVWNGVLFLAWILLACSMMEALFEFCIGCKLYYLLIQMRIVR